MRSMARCRPLASADAIDTVPLSSTSIWAPVCSTMARMVLPPGPMMSRILSGLMVIWTMRGAFGLSSSRGASSASAILSRMWSRPARACSSASSRMWRARPVSLMSICRAQTPLRVPVTLKSMSPR